MNPLTSTYDSEGNRLYNWPDGNSTKPLRSITTVCKMLPTGEALIRWAAKTTAEYAVGDNEWTNMSDEEAVNWLKSRPFVERDEAADRGSYIHGLVAARYGAREFQEEDEWESVGAEHVQGYVEAAAHFIEQKFLNVHPRGLEVELARPDWGIAGTCDLVARDEFGRLWIVDWKTGSSIYPSHGLQIMAYSACTERLKVDITRNRLIGVPTNFNKEKKIEMRVVHLRENGSWRAYEPRCRKIDWFTLKCLRYIARWNDATGNSLKKMFKPSEGGKA